MKLFDWVKKKGQATKENLKSNVNYKEVKETSENIREMASAILSPKEQLKNAKEETFQQAKSRLGVTDLDLVQNYRNYAYIFYVSMFFSLLCFLFAVYYLFFKHSMFSAITVMAIMSFCLANSFKFSFRAFQIKHQKLCSVKEWWERSGEWFPKL